MSCFIVSDFHMDVILDHFEHYHDDLCFYNEETGYWREFKPSLIEDMTKLGNILMNKNIDAYNQRYNENIKKDQYKFHRHQEKFSTIQILKALHCYQYQASDAEDWERSNAKEIYYNLIDDALRMDSEYINAYWEMSSFLHKKEGV